MAARAALSQVAPPRRWLWGLAGKSAEAGASNGLKALPKRGGLRVCKLASVAPPRAKMGSGAAAPAGFGNFPPEESSPPEA